MFSPYYAWAGHADPDDHVAINLALYGPRGRWAMTERGRRSLSRAADHFTVAGSSLAWDGAALTVTIDERAAPIPLPLRGRLVVRPTALANVSLPLDPAGRHVWSPIAPHARVEAAFDAPALSWTGTGYLDANAGVEMLEEGFRAWDWSRAHVGAETVVLYETLRRDGGTDALALRFAPDGTMTRQEPPPHRALAPSPVWRIARATRCDADGPARVRRTWEDTPFYARSELDVRLYGAPAHAVHESLDLDRFANPVVRLLLPVRMPRRA